MQECSVFTGCSYTEGIGLDHESNSKDLWVNIVHQSCPNLSGTALVNLGKGGASNLDIFQQAVRAIALHKCKYLFVQWTELYRTTVNPGVELYPTSSFWGGGGVLEDININPHITVSASYQKNIKNRFFDLNHIHWEITKTLNYCNTLQSLCNRFGVTVVFVNGIITDWDYDYFTEVDNERIISDSTPFTKKILNLDSRNDTDYIQLYKKIHHDYSKANGLPVACNWINLYNSFRTHFYLDQGNDNIHPGINSQHAFAEYILTHLD